VIDLTTFLITTFLFPQQVLYQRGKDLSAYQLMSLSVI